MECPIELTMAELDDLEPLESLVAHYGISMHRVTTGDAVALAITGFPRMPMRSLSRFARDARLGLSKGPETGSTSRSDKYAKSMLRIERPANVAVASSGDESGHVEGTTVSVMRPQKAGSTSMFAAFRDDDDDDDDEHIDRDVQGGRGRGFGKGGGVSELILPTDLCCVCLEPLLHAERAKAGESLSILECFHVLHAACARSVQVRLSCSITSSLPEVRQATLS